MDLSKGMPDPLDRKPEFSWPMDRVLQIQDSYQGLFDNPRFRQSIFEVIHTANFSGYWAEFVEPTSREQLNSRISAALHARFLSKAVETLNLNNHDAVLADVLLQGDIPGLGDGSREHVSPEFYDRLRACSSMTEFEAFCGTIVEAKLEQFRDPRNPYRHRGEHATIIEGMWRDWHERLATLSPNLIASVKVVHQEFFDWIRTHPDIVEDVAWEALERIVAEIFASRGFEVSITARVRGASSDLIAIRGDEFGVDTRYLVEVKHYQKNRKIGMNIVNAVIGAARRAKVEHAFLITTSSFSRDVVEQQPYLRDLRLHLRDGEQLKEWLSDYRPPKSGGLWLPSRLLP